MTDLPRVTEILNCFTKYDSVPQEILKNAAARGTQVHAICAGLAKGAWIPDGAIKEEHLPYVDSFRNWSEKQVEEYQIIETRFADDELGYTGQVDFVIKSHDGHVYLVDLKTSSKPNKTHPIQMAAYKNLLAKSKIDIKGAYLVYLSKDGQYPYVDYLEDMETEQAVFMSALQCYNYFNKRKHGKGTKQ
jgi:hypothetical protein